MIEPGFISRASVLSAPNPVSIVLTADEAIVSTGADSNTQIDFILRPSVSHHGIAEFNDPVLREIATGERNTI